MVLLISIAFSELCDTVLREILYDCRNQKKLLKCDVYVICDIECGIFYFDCILLNLVFFLFQLHFLNFCDVTVDFDWIAKKLLKYDVSVICNCSLVS